MGKKICQRKKASITLEPDCYSIHTFEAPLKVSKFEFNRVKGGLYQSQKGDHANYIYPDRDCKGHHVCTKFANDDIRIRLEENKLNREATGYYIRLARGQQELVIYDKTYQLTENNLVVDYEKLPAGVLRVYGRKGLLILAISSPFVCGDLQVHHLVQQVKAGVSLVIEYGGVAFLAVRGEKHFPALRGAFDGEIICTAHLSTEIVQCFRYLQIN